MTARFHSIEARHSWLQVSVDPTGVFILKMDSSWVCDENSEMDYPPSSEDQIERSNTDTGYSTPGGHSLDYSRTISEVSSYSEPSFLDEPLPLPLGLPNSKLVGRASAVITELRIKQHADVLEEKLRHDDITNSGQFTF